MRKFLRYPILLPVLAFYLYLAGSAPFLGQWDSYDYLKQIVSHRLSPLGFGRPVFLGYNILLWESMKHIFHLGPLRVEDVAMIGIVLLGVLGILLFHELARRFLSPAASRMAALGLAISPMYAVYSGFIMTEIPMLVALIASALMLLKAGRRHPATAIGLSGILFGMAVGIREQALTLGAAFLWILWSRVQMKISRFRSVLLFGSAAAAAVLIPVLCFYLADPAAFLDRTRIWLHAIPMGKIEFWNNVQSSLLYTLAICPAAWMAAAAAAVCALSRDRSASPGKLGPETTLEPSIRNPILGIICCVVAPIVVLWCDADVQIHPRYLLIVLPGSLIFCASIFDRWTRSGKRPAAWAIVHVLVFGAAIVILSPFRQEQSQKMQFAKVIREALPGKALIIAGSYSPILDYYRGVGVRPQWQTLWSGWDWDSKAADSVIRKSWSDRIPVYLSEDPLGWRRFESEYLHYYFFLKDCKREPVAPKLFRIYPPGAPAGRRLFFSVGKGENPPINSSDK